MDGSTLFIVAVATVIVIGVIRALSSARAKHGPLGRPKSGDNWTRGRLHSGNEWIGELPAWVLLPIALLVGIAILRFPAHDSRLSAAVLSLVVVAGLAKPLYLLFVRMKHGISTLQAAPFPIGLNEELTGELIAPLRDIPQEGVKLRLQCIHEVVDDSGDVFRRTRRRVVRRSLFEASQRIVPNLIQARNGRLHVPFTFSFGADVPPTSGTDIWWTREATADIPGIDYHATFRLPVVKNRIRRPQAAQPATAAV